MSRPTIIARAVGKKYCRHTKRAMVYAAGDVLREAAGMRPPRQHLRRGEFWALQDISFEVSEGECLGVVGSNGAGKSTLLKLLAGIIPPDQGELRVRGKVAALIEIGAGFHPLLTGRENIYL